MRDVAIGHMVGWLAAMSVSATEPDMSMPTFGIALLAGGAIGAMTRWALAGPDDPNTIKTFIGGMLLAVGLSVLAFGWLDLKITLLRAFGIAWACGALADYWPKLRALLAARGLKFAKGNNDAAR